jgi:hypothetical protein
MQLTMETPSVRLSSLPPIHVQKFLPRQEATPIPIIDKLPVEAHTLHMGKQNQGDNKITKYEKELTRKFEKAGFHVIPQFLVPDLDNAAGVRAEELLTATSVKRNTPAATPFVWSYDLAAVPLVSQACRSGLGELDWENAILVEVNGRHHKNPFNQIQDKRKAELAHTLLKIPVVHVRNQDVAYPSTVYTIIRKAEKCRSRF